MGYEFSGTYEHQLDAKRRIRIPSKLKGVLGVGYSITIGTDHCLWIMPAETTHELHQRMAELDTSDLRSRATKRRVLEMMYTPEEDPQGRVVLPRKLIDYATIDKDVVFIGQGNYIELWSAEAYDEYMDNYDDIDIGQYIKL